MLHMANASEGAAGKAVAPLTRKLLGLRLGQQMLT